jgi:deoxyribodipyrimidine photo-lyase
MTTCVWFRQDLRISDNPALHTASALKSPILCLYILDINAIPAMGCAQQWWLHHSLQALAHALATRGLMLHLIKGDPQSVLTELVNTHHIDTLIWNRCYEPYHLKRDLKIQRALENMHIQTHIFDRFLLQAPWEGLNQKNQPYQVFTQYWKNACKLRKPPSLYPIPKFTKKNLTEFSNISSDKLAQWDLLPSKPNWADSFSTYWSPGEQGALNALTQFINNSHSNYSENRDKPDTQGTSHLSPHLHFGEISPWQIYHALPRDNDEAFIRQLTWRDFSYHLLYHFPTFPDQNFKKIFDRFPWEKNASNLQAWQKGLTGYPIVDAGMRELWHTGYMHNRVRMVVASFLTKDLLLHWKVGADWFWDTLLDADLANNAVSWQWVAGCGVDAAPYFRIFNPILQGEKFDPNGTYVKKWIPEIAALPNNYIHKPWEAPPLILQDANIKLGIDYPLPIVNHNDARKQALSSYKEM